PCRGNRAGYRVTAESILDRAGLNLDLASDAVATLDAEDRLSSAVLACCAQAARATYRVRRRAIFWSPNRQRRPSAGLQPATFALNEEREIWQWQRPTKRSAKGCGQSKTTLIRRRSRRSWMNCST